MQSFQTFLTALALTVVSSSVQAANVTYDAVSYNGNITSGHSLWFKGGVMSSTDNHYHFVPGGIFQTDESTTGTLSGKIYSQVDLDSGSATPAGFDVLFNYNDQFVKSDGSSFTPVFKAEATNPLPPPNDPYYLFLSGGTLSGFGALAGLEMTVSEKGSFNNWATQIGLNANAKDNDYGMANWFMTTVTSLCTGCGADYTNRLDGKQGDVNVDLTGARLTDVPLPAAGWLLIAGLGGLAAAGRRKKA